MNKQDKLRKEWEKSISYHPPRTEEQRNAHAHVNDLIKQVGYDLIEVLPDCDEADFVRQCLQEARMWANASLAIHVNNPNRDKEE